MRDWASLIIATALFAFLSPGLIIQLPGKQHPVDFIGMKTSVTSIFVHAVIYGLIIIVLLVSLDLHIYA